MSTMHDHQANGYAKEASPQSEDTTEQIHEVLQHFAVLSSKAERHIFKFAYLYLIVIVLLSLLWKIRYLPGWEDVWYYRFFDLPGLIFPSTYNQYYNGFTNLSYLTSLELLFVVGICLIVWTFNIWLKSVPNTLREIFEKNCIYVRTGDLNEQYLDFLKRYRDGLRKRRRYTISFILIGAYLIYSIFDYNVPFGFDLCISKLTYYCFVITDQQSFIVEISDLLALFAVVIAVIGFMYCLGILFWSLLISGQYIRKLARPPFELRIEPVHPDNCGGLHALGNFCFASAAPLVVGSAFFIGWLLVAFHFATFEIGPQEVALILFVILVFSLPTAIFAFFRPLWSMHTKMLSKREKDDERYVAEIAPLREKIQVLLDANQLDEAKPLKDKKESLEALHIPYPTWPFDIRSKFYTTILGAGGSLLLGVLTGVFTAKVSNLF